MPDKESDSETNSNEKLLEHPSYEELLQKLDEAEKTSNQHWERILRMQAESENAQRRSERDIANAHKYALEKFVGDILPVIDSLELCIVSVPEDAQGAIKSVIEGVSLTLKMLYNVLEKYGIKQIDPSHEAFDPEYHQAISIQNDPSVKPGTVISVLQKGYSLNQRLIRPALVVVAQQE